LPYIGPNEEEQFLATGFSGNGYTFGAVAAVMVRDWITGVKNPWRDLFNPQRKKVRGGAWDYLLENKDYPYYMIRRKIAARGRARRRQDLEARRKKARGLSR